MQSSAPDSEFRKVMVSKGFLEDLWPGWNLKKVHKQKKFKERIKAFGFHPESYQEPERITSEEWQG